MAEYLFMKNTVHISVISPVYQAEGIIPELVSRLESTLNKLTDNYEIILVEDHGPDNSWEVIEQLSKTNSRLKGIRLSRNFGQHYAITCGLDHALGDWVVVMDCDLQDQPEEILGLYNKANKGNYDIVFARRVLRQDKILKRTTSILFHKLNSYLSGVKTDPTIANFGIYSSRVVVEFNKMRETARSFYSLVSILGFNSSTVDVEHSVRFSGETSYTWSKLINLTLDVVLSNSNKPLKLTAKLGFIISFISFMLAFYNLVAHYCGIIKVDGFTTTVFSIWFVGGMILFVLGIIGLYIGKIFDQVKGRPLYIVAQKINFHNASN